MCRKVFGEEKNYFRWTKVFKFHRSRNDFVIMKKYFISLLFLFPVGRKCSTKNSELRFQPGYVSRVTAGKKIVSMLVTVFQYYTGIKHCKFMLFIFYGNEHRNYVLVGIYAVVSHNFLLHLLIQQ